MLGRRSHRPHMGFMTDGIGMLCILALTGVVLLVVPATRAWTLDAIQNVCTAIIDAFFAVFTSLAS